MRTRVCSAGPRTSSCVSGCKIAREETIPRPLLHKSEKTTQGHDGWIAIVLVSGGANEEKG